MDKRLNIKQWDAEDRPREKMMRHGASSLSNAELLAILIGSGNAEETSIELMRRLLCDCHNDLNELGKKTWSDYLRYKGLGTAKAATLIAALELGKRRKATESDRKVILCAQDVYELFHPLLCDLTVEEFWILLLNQSNKVIQPIRISSGGINQTSADVRIILKEALLHNATGLILCHNHPSGNPSPSQEDKQLTQRICQGAATMNLTVADHLIVCDGAYFSFLDHGLLPLS